MMHYPSDLASTAAVIGDSCEIWLTDISKKLTIDSSQNQPIDVYLYPDQGAYREATGHEVSGYVLGRASTEGYIELEVSGTFATPEQVAGHEITHVIIFRMLGRNVNALPLWANEGIAKYMSEDFDVSDQTVLADAITQYNTIPLSSITHKFPSGSAQALAYAEGASAIRFYVETYGARNLAILIKKTGQTGSFDEAIREITGLSARQFESKWMRSIDSGYGVSQSYRVVRMAAAITMPLLAILAFLGVQRRKKRTVEEDTDDEEEDEDDLSDDRL